MAGAVLRASDPADAVRNTMREAVNSGQIPGAVVW
jgi:hypothetical protein